MTIAPQTFRTMTELIAETLANPVIGAAGTAFLMAGVALWLAGAWWAYADASRRTGKTAAQTAQRARTPASGTLAGSTR